MAIEDTIRAALDRAGIDATLPSADPHRSIRGSVDGSERVLPTVRVAERLDADDTADLILGEVLGRGGMGVVRTGWQTPLKREVAVKLLNDAENDNARLGLLREAQITGALEHPNIPPVHFLGRDDTGRPLLVMKRIEGTSWRTMIEDPEHPKWQTVSGSRIDYGLGVWMQVANAIAFAHSHGYVHRDLKPDNVMIGDFGEVYVLDWGIAARIEDLREVDVPRVVGTPAYIAPEMIDERFGAVDRRTDVFLLGGTLYHVLTGSPPNGGDLIGAMLRAFDASPHEYPNQTPTALSALVERALCPRPEDRFESVEAMRSAIVDFMDARASTRLVRQGAEKLEALRAGPSQLDPVAAHRLFGECRFAFEEALRLRPDLAPARTYRTEAIVLMIDREIDRNNADGAELLLAELDEQDRAVYAERIAELRRADAEREDERRRLTRMEAELDVSAGGRARAYVALSMALLISLIGVYVLEVFDLSGPRAWMTGRVALLVFVGFAGLLFRRELLANRAAKRIAASILVLGFVAPVHLAVGLRLGQPIEAILTVDMMFLGMGLTFVAVMVDPRTGFTAAVAFAGSIACAVWPLRVAVIVAWTLVLVVGVQVLVWGTSRRASHREPRYEG